MADKARRADGYQLADKGVRLNLSVGANSNAALDLDKRAHEAAIAKRALVNVRRLHMRTPRRKDDAMSA